MKTLRIFISSPGDVGREREISHKVISRVEASFGGRVVLQPYYWEHEPMRATRGDFQEQIPEPETFDLVVCVLWSRLGSRLHPGKHCREDGTPYASGTEYEFESAIRGFAARGKPDLLVYRRTEKPSVPLDPPEEIEAKRKQWEALRHFCDTWFREGGDFRAAYNNYDDTADFEQRFEAGLRRIVEDELIAEGEESGGTRPVRQRWWQGSPYRGLHPFEFEHEPVFFGRTQARDKVLGALQARAQNQRATFVLIFGASGSGKSSLLRAGVMPWLVKPGVIDGVGLWRRAMLKPSATQEGDLLDILAAVLVEEKALPELIADGTPVEELAAMLKDEPKSIVGLIKGALGHAAALVQQAERLEKVPVARLALGLDQIEEIFTLTKRFDGDSRRSFFRAIRALAESRLVWIVGTLRSDFFPQCEAVSALIDLKADGGEFHLTAPTRVELSQMIRYPAEAAGVVFEESPTEGKLDEVIASEALDRPGALPLLEYALDELFAKGADDGLLTHVEYDAVGRVEKAVAKKAEETFQAWRRESEHDPKRVLDEVLRELVTVGAEESKDLTPVRRVALMSDVARHAGGETLASAFVQERLFTADHDEGRGQATLTVAHEVLLTSWARIADWLEADREFVLQRRRLDAVHLLWNQNREHDDYLLAPGKPLSDGKNLLELHRHSLDSDQVAFIEASQRREAERQLHLSKRRRRMMVGLSVLTVVSLAFAGWAVWNGERAKNAEVSLAAQLSETQRQLERSQLEEGRAWFERAKVAWEGEKDPLNALMFMGKAVGFHGFGRTGIESEEFERAHPSLFGAPMTDRLNEDARLAFAGVTEAYSKCILPKVMPTWSSAMEGSNSALPLFNAQMAFSPDGLLLATTSPDGIVLWDLVTGGKSPKQLKDSLGDVYALAFSPDGTSLAAGVHGARSTVKLWDISSGAKVLDLNVGDHCGAVVSVKFNRDGTRLAAGVGGSSGSTPGEVRLWEVESGEVAGIFVGDTLGANCIAFSPDQSVLAVGIKENDSRVILCDLATGIESVILENGMGEVTSLAYSPDGRIIACGSKGGTVSLLRGDDGEIIDVLSEESGYHVTSLDFTPCGAHLVIGLSGDLSLGSMDEGGFQLWELRNENDFLSSKVLASLLGYLPSVVDVAFSPDGQQVAAGFADGTVTLWSVDWGRRLVESPTYEAFGELIAISPDRTCVASENDEGTISLLDADSGREFACLQARLDADERSRTGWQFPPPALLEGGLAFAPDGLTLAAGYGGDQRVRLWDLAAGAAVAAFQMGGSVFDLEFSPDGNRLAGISGAELKLWDIARGEELITVENRMLFRDLVVGPEGKTVATKSPNGDVMLFDVSTGLQLPGQPNFPFQPRWIWGAGLHFIRNGGRTVGSCFEIPTLDLVALLDSGLFTLREGELQWIQSPSRKQDKLDRLNTDRGRNHLLKRLSERKISDSQRLILRLQICTRSAAWRMLPPLWREVKCLGLDSDPAVTRACLRYFAIASRVLATVESSSFALDLLLLLKDSMRPSDFSDVTFSLALQQAVLPIALNEHCEFDSVRLFMEAISKIAPQPWLEALIVDLSEPKENESQIVAEQRNRVIQIVAQCRPESAQVLRAAITTYPSSVTARELLEDRLMALDGATPSDFARSAYAATISGNRPRAEKLIDQSRRKYPTNPYIALMVGWSYLNLGNPVEAATHFEKGGQMLDEGDWTPASRFGKAIALWQSGHADSAIECYRGLVMNCGKGGEDWSRAQTLVEFELLERHARSFEEIRQATLKRYPDLAPKSE